MANAYQESFMPILHRAGIYEFKNGQHTQNRICYTSTIVLIDEGYGKLWLNQKLHSLQPGVLIYIPGGKMHRWEADEHRPMTHIFCYFDWAYLDRKGMLTHPVTFVNEGQEMRAEAIDPGYSEPLCEVSYLEKAGVWKQLFQAMYASFYERKKTDILEYMNRQSHFLQFLRHYVQHAAQPDTYMDPRIQKALRWLEKQGDGIRPDMLETWLASAEIGRSRFFALFKQHTGFSPAEYVGRLRMNQASQDLRSSRLSITDIAEKYHYPSLHQFSKAFKRVSGVSPMKYRQMNSPYD